MKTKLITKPDIARVGRSISFLAWMFLGLTWLMPSQDLAAAPTITQQPLNVSVSPGATAVFSVTATTTSPPLSYQWRFGATILPGANLATLSTTANAQCRSNACSGFSTRADSNP